MRLICPLLLIATLFGCTTPVNAPVNVNPIVEAGLVGPGAVRVDPNAVQVQIAEALESIKAEVQVTLKNLTQRVEGKAYANSGRDTDQNVVSVALDGSGWPIVGIAAVGMALVAAIWWLRRKGNKLEGWTETLAGGIKSLPPAARNPVLDKLNGKFADEIGFKKWLDKRDLTATKR